MIDIGRWYGMICLTAGFVSTYGTYWIIGPDIGLSEYAIIFLSFIAGTMLANYVLGWGLYFLSSTGE